MADTPRINYDELKRLKTAGVLTDDARPDSWRAAPHSLTAPEARGYINRFAAELREAGALPKYHSFVPSSGNTEDPNYNFMDDRLVGLASGQPLLPGVKVAVQEKYPQLTRLFGSTHEGFHAMDKREGISLDMLSDMLSTQGLPINLEDPNDGKKLSDESKARLMNKFVQSTESFADAAAAIYMLDRIPGRTTEKFLEEWKNFRQESRNISSNYSSTPDTIGESIDRYKKGLADGTIEKGSLSVAKATAIAGEVTWNVMMETRKDIEDIRLVDAAAPAAKAGVDDKGQKNKPEAALKTTMLP